MMDEVCLCGSGLNYLHCCGAYLERGEIAATAQALMRSRYCAYVLKNEGYLLDTWDVEMRPKTLNLEQDSFVRWLGLKVLSTQAGGVDDNSGIVEFIARYKVNGKAQRLHEVSRFIKKDGQWFYVDGDVQ